MNLVSTCSGTVIQDNIFGLVVSELEEMEETVLVNNDRYGNRYCGDKQAGLLRPFWISPTSLMIVAGFVV